MRKIGVLTFHYVINEGAQLQAYSVLRALEDTFNCKVEIIDYHSLKKEIGNVYLNLGLGFKRRYFIKAVQRYLNCKINSKKIFKSKLSIKSYYGDSYKKFIKRFGNDYDMIIVGSDEIWRMDFDSSDLMVLPWPNPYWLDPKLECKKVAYAASANRSNIEKMTDVQQKLLGEIVESFDLISVRDDFTYNIIAPYKKNEKIETVILPDPTFYLDLKETNVDKKLEVNGVNLSLPIIIMLLSDVRLGEIVRKYCDKQGYQLIAIEDYNCHAQFNFTHNLDNSEWADIFRMAKLCVTDRYHGTIFSMKNKIPFLSLDGNTRSKSKLFSLLSELDLKYHYCEKNTITSEDDLDQQLGKIYKIWDEKTIEKKLKLQRDKIESFLFKIKDSMMIDIT